MTQFLPHFTILLLKLRPRIAGGSRLGLHYGCSLDIIRLYLSGVTQTMLLVPEPDVNIRGQPGASVKSYHNKMQTDQNKFVTSSPTDYEMRFIKAWPLSFPVCDLSCQAQAEIMSPKEDSTSLVLDVVMMTNVWISESVFLGLFTLLLPLVNSIRSQHSEAGIFRLVSCIAR